MQIRTFWRCTAILTLMGFVSSVTVGCVAPGHSTPKNVADFTRPYEKSKRPTYDASITASAAYFAGYEHEKSLKAANDALKIAKDDRGRALACAYAAQACGAMGRFQEAGELATKGQRFDPNSTYLASLRLAFSKNAGNTIEEQAAEAALRQLDPTYQKKPVFLVEAALVVLVATFCYTIYAHKEFAKAPSEAEKQCHRDASLVMMKVAGGTILTLIGLETAMVNHQGSLPR